MRQVNTVVVNSDDPDDGYSYSYIDVSGQQHPMSDQQVSHYLFGSLTEDQLALHFAREKVAKSDHPSLAELRQRLKGVLPDDVSGVVKRHQVGDNHA